MNEGHTANDGHPIVVIIPTHDRLRLLERTVDSVLACEAPTDRIVRLIVIENGGRFGVEELLANKATWLKPEYFYCEQPNKSSALNAVLDTLDDALVVFFDDDIRADPAILIHYAAAARETPPDHFFGGGMLIDYEEPPPDWLLGHLPPSARGWHPETYSGVTRDLAFMGCSWAAYASDIGAAGGFNPRFGPGGTSGGGGQEQAMQTALRQRGLTPHYIRDALVWHYVPKSRCSPEWALRRTYRNAVTSGHRMIKADGTRHIGGIPTWLIRKFLSDALRVIGSKLRLDPMVRFESTNALMATLGRIKGSRAHYVASKGRH